MRLLTYQFYIKPNYIRMVDIFKTIIPSNIQLSAYIRVYKPIKIVRIL